MLKLIDKTHKKFECIEALDIGALLLDFEVFKILTIRILDLIRQLPSWKVVMLYFSLLSL